MSLPARRSSSAPHRTTRRIAGLSLGLLVLAGLVAGCSTTDTAMDPSQLNATYVKSNGTVAPEFQGSTTYQIKGGLVDTTVDKAGETTTESTPLDAMKTRNLVNAARFVQRKLAENPIPAGGCGVGGVPVSLSATYGTEEIVDVSGVIATEPCNEVYAAIQLFANELEGKGAGS